MDLQDALLFTGRSAQSLEGIVQLVLESACTLTCSDLGAGLSLASHLPSRELTFFMSVEDGTTSLRCLTPPKNPGEGPSRAVLRSGKPQIISDSPGCGGSPGVVSSLWAPLIENGQVVAVLHVEASAPRHYGERHLQELTTIANAATVPVLRSLCHQRAREVGADVDFLGVSGAFLDLEKQVRLAAFNNVGTVLITGERGTGKELVARAIHYWSERRTMGFVPVLASALAETLFADELFGHERHAFTGAALDRPGKFRAADGGSILFDEVADMPPVVQSALLRILETGELPRVGRDLPLRVDVRAMAATNADVHTLAASGKLRADLYDRLSTFEISVPPLRSRIEDIPLLASYFFRKHCHRARGGSLRPNQEAYCAKCNSCILAACATEEFYKELQSYDWPGNVRQLEHLVIRIRATAPDPVLDITHLRAVESTNRSRFIGEDLRLNSVVRNHLARVLRIADYNQSKACRLLDLPLSTMRSKMKKLGVGLQPPRTDQEKDDRPA